MRIDGYLDERYEPPAPFLRATVLSKGLELRHVVNFHVDTGAAVTTLLDKDVKRLKIDLEKMKRAERGLFGIGGSLTTYVIEDSALLFQAGNGKVVEERLRIYAGVHDVERLSKVERKLILELPSLLGRDLIYRFKLVLDKAKNQLCLER
jgi:hypothetical protein